MTQATTTADETRNLLSRPLTELIELDWEKTIYLLFILLAIITRFWNLGGRVMSHDESLHTQFSYQFYNGEGYNHTPLMHGPFLFHITAVSYWLFGDSDLSARIPVALFGIVLVAMPYLLRRWLGRIGSLFTSFLFLISPYISYYSRYIRHDIYVIVWALIVFIAMWQYIREREEKNLWWFAAGTALMFATKEVAFIYVTIFGGMLLLRLAVHAGTSDWIGRTLPKLWAPLVVAVLGILLLGGGFIGQRLTAESAASAATTEPAQGFAANPDDAQAAAATTTNDGSAFRWTQLVGLGVFSLGLFLALREMRPHLDQYPEFDLAWLFATLVLPSVSPVLTSLAGWNPRDYSFTKCFAENTEGLSAWQQIAVQLFNQTCWQGYLSSGVVRSGMFLVLTMAVAILAGLWWNRRRWLIAAAIYYSIFTFFFTSVFTNPGGWASGMVGSLGYWLEQQGVERGSQPWFYYFFVVPFYEFLPLIFSLAAIRLWLRQKRLAGQIGYWFSVILAALLTYSLSNWWFNRAASLAGEATSPTLGWILALLVVIAAAFYWFLIRRKQLLQAYGLGRSFRGIVTLDELTDFVPMLVVWLLLTWLVYSYAGEKMPWLSTHFVIPMAMLSGWYFNERLNQGNPRLLLSGATWRAIGLTAVFIVSLLLFAGPLLLGQLQFGDQQRDALIAVGRFMGTGLAAGALFYLWRLNIRRLEPDARRPVILLALFGLLSLLTIRFSYMANVPNADYTTEFMVYAHGAPATKNAVLQQIEALSMRMYGDKSIKVAFDNDSSWPFTWYLREYPNRVYFGENPGHSLNDAPVIIVGSLNWDKVEPYLSDNYEVQTHTFLWWPMEEYRKLSWNAILGEPGAANRRGLGNPEVRQALWDIFFYRDYKKLGEVFGGTYTAGQWPLRHELRLYLRKDVLANLWDYGTGAVSVVPPQDPYAEKDFQVQPVMVINESGVAGINEGELFAPRNVAVGPDGRIFVADSGNNRIQVFGQDGSFITAWGGSGTGPGQFNEPWGIVVDESYVYIADTWNHRIQKFTHDGQFVAVFGSSGSPTDAADEALGLFFGPRDLVLLDNNRLLVTDTGNHSMQVLDREGNFLQRVGNFGNLLGQFNEPVGLGIASNDTLFLADTWNGRIQQFNPDLQATFEWEVDAWAGQSINNKPYLAVDSHRRVYATDPEGYRVLIFSELGDYLGRFGHFSTDSTGFGLPNGIAIDGEDNIYIADAANNRILKFAPLFGQSTISDQPSELEDAAGNAADGAGAQDAESDDNADEGIPTTTADEDAYPAP